MAEPQYIVPSSGPIVNLSKKHDKVLTLYFLFVCAPALTFWG